ncbi:MAG: class I SAM-dependent methyltransferase [Deltaproteobacteria bacterium]|nr:MAG: class I SAM-dependent methyltransferase [Deltaproteobacteria bacterium]
MRGAAVALLLLATAASAGRFDAYFAELESPDRAGWQQPARVVETLRLRAGMTVADVGAGTGYFARRFAAAVGPTGKVLALDIEPEMLEELRRRAPDATNIETRRAEPADPGLAPASVDVVFICDTGHHLHDRVRYYGKLRRALRRGGRLVLVDFYKRPLPVGPPVQEKLSRAETQREAEAAGFRLRASHTFLTHQYFLEFAR